MKRKTDRLGSMKNLLIQWELRRKTDLQAGEATISCLFVLSAGSSRPRTLLFGTAGPSHRRSNHGGSGPSELEPSGASLRRCDVNERQGHFRGRKNDRLIIGKKPPNPVGTEEKNQGGKDLVVVQSSKINLCGQWCIELDGDHTGHRAHRS